MPIHVIEAIILFPIVVGLEQAFLPPPSNEFEAAHFHILSEAIDSCNGGPLPLLEEPYPPYVMSGCEHSAPTPFHVQATLSAITGARLQSQLATKLPYTKKQIMIVIAKRKV